MKLLYSQGGPSVRYGGTVVVDKPYWYAQTDNGNFDGDGPTPLDAVSALVLQMEDAYAETEKDDKP